MEVVSNELFDRDAETNALVRVVAAGEGGEKVVKGNKLYVRDAETNALVPVVKVLGEEGSGGGGTGGGDAGGDADRLLTATTPNYGAIRNISASLPSGFWPASGAEGVEYVCAATGYVSIYPYWVSTQSLFSLFVNRCGVCFLSGNRAGWDNTVFLPVKEGDRLLLSSALGSVNASVSAVYFFPPVVSQYEL